MREDDRTKITFLKIPAGKFQMGTPAATFGEEGRDKERPVHEVTISQPFWMAAHPVTNQQYRLFLDANPSVPKPDHLDDTRINGDRQPVVNVSWKDAQRFCAWGGFRLPTEAEWEYACRAGSRGQYCFGDSPKDLRDYAWFDANSEGRTHDVGSKRANAWGLYDMHGNVWEWCQDVYGLYEKEAITDWAAHQGVPETLRVFRGGSWNDDARGCRSARRLGDSPNFGNPYRGFRVCLATDPAEPEKPGQPRAEAPRP